MNEGNRTGEFIPSPGSELYDWPLTTEGAP
jgi:hypothetical protein